MTTRVVFDIYLFHVEGNFFPFFFFLIIHPPPVQMFFFSLRKPFLFLRDLNRVSQETQAKETLKFALFPFEESVDTLWLVKGEKKHKEPCVYIPQSIRGNFRLKNKREERKKEKQYFIFNIIQEVNMVVVSLFFLFLPSPLCLFLHNFTGVAGIPRLDFKKEEFVAFSFRKIFYLFIFSVKPN